jgi:hypothetical protein
MGIIKNSIFGMTCIVEQVPQLKGTYLQMHDI